MNMHIKFDGSSGYLKTLGSPWIRLRSLFSKILNKICNICGWILIYKCCKFGEKICYNFRDIEFFPGHYFFGVPPCRLEISFDLPSIQWQNVRQNLKQNLCSRRPYIVLLLFCSNELRLVDWNCNLADRMRNFFVANCFNTVYNRFVTLGPMQI